MKKIIIVFMALTTTLVSMTLIADLYTKSQINNLIEKACQRYSPYTNQMVDGNYVRDEDYNHYYKEGLIGPFRLFEVSNANKFSLFNDEAEWGSDEWWNGYIQWKSVIESNPELAYQALKIYGDYIVKQLSSQLEYSNDNGNFRHGTKSEFSDGRNANWWTKKKFWDANKKSIRDYQKLIDELLKLNDKDLNYFITTNDVSDAASYGFDSWLKEKGLMKSDGHDTNNSMPSANNQRFYPGDLLCLTKRVFTRNPKWTPRKFLTEVNKFSNEVLEVIEDNN
jgi:hypothetical protein